MPEPSGSMRSQRTTSGSFFCTAARASAREAAVSTRHPSASNTMERKSRRDASSSTMRRSTRRLYFAKNALEARAVAAFEPFGDGIAFGYEFYDGGGFRDSRSEGCWVAGLLSCFQSCACFAFLVGEDVHDSAVLRHEVDRRDRVPRLADAMDAAVALIELHRIPREVVVDDDAGVLEVEAFARDVGHDLYVGSQPGQIARGGAELREDERRLIGQDVDQQLALVRRLDPNPIQPPPLLFVPLHAQPS